MVGMLYLCFILAGLACILKMELIAIGIITGYFSFIFLILLQEETERKKNLLERICIRVLKIMIVFSIILLPIISIIHQERKERQEIETITFDYAIQVTYVYEVPEYKSIYVNGKVVWPIYREGYTYEEVFFEFYSEDGTLLETISQEDIENNEYFEMQDSAQQRIEVCYVESIKMDHESDLLNINDEIKFLKGECLKNHREYSSKKKKTKTTIFVDSSKIQFKTKYDTE